MSTDSGSRVGNLIVSDDGIYTVLQDDGNSYITMMVLPKEIFVEAYEKYIKENDNEVDNRY